MYEYAYMHAHAYLCVYIRFRREIDIRMLHSFALLACIISLHLCTLSRYFGTSFRATLAHHFAPLGHIISRHLGTSFRATWAHHFALLWHIISRHLSDEKNIHIQICMHTDIQIMNISHMSHSRSTSVRSNLDCTNGS